MSNLWEPDTTNEGFKPTRRYILHFAHDCISHRNRVREGPGGEDHMNNVSPWVMSKENAEISFNNFGRYSEECILACGPIGTGLMK